LNSNRKGAYEKAYMLRQFPLYFILIIVLAVVSGPANARAFSPGKAAPDIAGGPWINSNPLTLAELKDRVVLVEFWTYG
jgi:hypothetical protein